MKITLKLEHLALMVLGIYAFYESGFEWQWFLVLLFIPDLSIIGYTLGNKVGAVIYNTFHNYVTAVLFYLLGMLLDLPYVELAGVMIFTHACMDRALGYGLKYFTSFHDTHLGRIGKSR